MAAQQECHSRTRLHAGQWISLCLKRLIMGDEQVRSWITGAFVDHPRISTAIIGAASIILKYSHSSSPAGAVAQAKEVINSPDAPTASQVDAATTKP